MARIKRRVYRSKYALSSIVYCSKCGKIYRRIAWNNRGKCSIVWRCLTRVEGGPSECDAQTIKEDVLKEVTVKAINKILSEKESIADRLKENIGIVLNLDNSYILADIEERLKTAQEKLLKVKTDNYDCIDVYESVNVDGFSSSDRDILLREKELIAIEKEKPLAQLVTSDRLRKDRVEYVKKHLKLLDISK